VCVRARATGAKEASVEAVKSRIELTFAAARCLADLPHTLLETAAERAAEDAV
jgi:hypothetical protein